MTQRFSDITQMPSRGNLLSLKREIILCFIFYECSQRKANIYWNENIWNRGERSNET
jgi:hypothetical protein